MKRNNHYYNHPTNNGMDGNNSRGKWQNNNQVNPCPRSSTPSMNNSMQHNDVRGRGAQNSNPKKRKQEKSIDMKPCHNSGIIKNNSNNRNNNNGNNNKGGPRKIDQSSKRMIFNYLNPTNSKRRRRNSDITFEVKLEEGNNEHKTQQQQQQQQQHSKRSKNGTNNDHSVNPSISFEFDLKESNNKYNTVPQRRNKRSNPKRNIGIIDDAKKDKCETNDGTLIQGHIKQSQDIERTTSNFHESIIETDIVHSVALKQEQEIKGVSEVFEEHQFLPQYQECGENHLNPRLALGSDGGKASNDNNEDIRTFDVSSNSIEEDTIFDNDSADCIISQHQSPTQSFYEQAKTNSPIMHHPHYGVPSLDFETKDQTLYINETKTLDKDHKSRTAESLCIDLACTTKNKIPPKELKSIEYGVTNIPFDMKSSTLIQDGQYILTSVSLYKPNVKIVQLADFLVNENSASSHAVFHSFSFSVSLLNMLLDVMGFTQSMKANNMSTPKHCQISPLCKDKKPTQTTTTVGDFILEVIEQSKDSRPILYELSLSFRLASYFILSSCIVIPPDSKSSTLKKYRSRQEKMSELMKRSLLTLFICLREVMSRLIVMIPSNTDIMSFFAPGEPFSSAEKLLIDIVPLLTDMDSRHGNLGSNKSVALLKHLVKLEKSFNLLGDTTEARSERFDGLMEMFIRQLLQQESMKNATSLKKELEHCRNKVSSLGIIACTSFQQSKLCREVIHSIIDLRLRQAIVAKSKVAQDASAVKVTPGTVSNSSSSTYDIHDPLWYDEKSSSRKNIEYNMLHIDGCIYLARFLDMLTPSIRDESLEALQLQRNHTVYFLFHTLWENDPFPDNVCQAKSLRNRDNLKSAGLACILLAGKILDRPISMRRLIEMAEKIPFPDSNKLSIEKYEAKDLRANESIDNGDPKKSLIKEYESHLLFVFGFEVPMYDDFSLVPEINSLSQHLQINDKESHNLRSMLNHVGFTHSCMCLLDDSVLTVLSLYHLSCDVTGVSHAPLFEEYIHGDDRKVAERLFGFMKETVEYVRQRERWIEQLESTKQPKSTLAGSFYPPPDLSYLLEMVYE